MRILALILFGLVSAPLEQVPRLSSSIKGVVLQSGSLQPVAKAVVRLAKDGSEPLAVSTGVDGRFEFQNVPAGTYDLTAARNGYLTTAFGQRGPSGTGRKLSVEPGAAIDNIRLLITATGAISGRVFDNTGEPLGNVPVQALKYSYEDGQRTLKQVNVDQTNDLGEFRLFWLPPGQYMISAQPGNQSGAIFSPDHTVVVRKLSMDSDGWIVNAASAAAGAQKPGEAYVPVYYPGTADPQSASRVEVRPGADMRGIDFILAGVTTRKVRGTVIDSVTGLPADVANVQLVPRSDIGNTFRGSLDRGKFEIPGVLPGSYFLVANARIGPRDDIRIMAGRAAVEVGQNDLDNISVTMQPTIDITGSVLVEGRAEGLPPDAHPVIFLQGHRDWVLPSLSQSYATFRDRTEFEFSGVVEGEYQIWWDNLPSGLYFKSARFGAVDALNTAIRIDSRTTDRLQIVLGSGAGTLEGVVRDNLRNNVPGARVVLVPDAAHRQRADLYRTTSTDESGRFRLQGIPPGDYVLFAWEDIENGLWQDAEFLKRHESSGKPVRIVEGSRETVEIVAIPFTY
jgi:Carboxypeptidase regulatory-like domain